MFVDFDQLFGFFYRQGLLVVERGIDIPTVWLVTFALLWTTLTIFLASFIVMIMYKIRKLRADELADRKVALTAKGNDQTPTASEDWVKILQYLESDNPSDWKLAIIEADTLLDRLVQRMGYPGDNLGERLKAVEPSDFVTLQAAWEAHKVRNAIAHESGYQLNKREARRVIGLFEQVFKEFHYI